MDMSISVKVILKFSSKVWPSHIDNVVCAGKLSLFSSIKFVVTANCFIAIGVATEPQVDLLEGKSSDDIILLLLSHLDLVMTSMEFTGKMPSSAFVQGSVCNWKSQKFVEGSFVSTKPGFDAELTDIMAKPFGGGNSGKVFFCGDYTSTFLFNAEGAVESGRRAADLVIQFLRPTK
jgi:hypothetical protein